MDAALIASLVVLALIDSTSFGTLLIPIWMMLAPGRVRSSRLLIFLTTVAGFYFVLGIALTAGATAFLDDLRPVFQSGPARAAQLGVGVALLGYAVFARRRRGRSGGQPGRLLRWRERAVAGEGSPVALVGLALAAVGLEAATMLPYLAAIGLLSTAATGLALTVAVLAGYCVVMVLPALGLLLARSLAADAVRPALQRVNDWMTRNAAEGTAWILGVVGFLLARDAALHLSLLNGVIDLE